MVKSFDSSVADQMLAVNYNMFAWLVWLVCGIVVRLLLFYGFRGKAEWVGVLFGIGHALNRVGTQI